MSDDAPKTPADAAVVESDAKTHTVTVLGVTYPLAEKLTAKAGYRITKAQAEESLYGLVDGFSELIHKDKRQDFIDNILGDSDEAETLSLDDLFEHFTGALEKVTGRPLEQ